MTSSLYALLVGIDHYANPSEAPHLRGCVADVTGTERFLREQLGLPSENIRLLTARADQAETPEDLATRANILQAWDDHLGQAKAGDQIFFNYSGHGAQARSVNPNEPSGYDETIVPHDSRTPGIFDILDKELAQLIETVEKKGVQVTIFMDCCHSGSGTRTAASTVQGANAPKVRRCNPDERTRPLTSLLAGVTLVSSAASTRAAATRSPSGWIPLGKHVLLAGCRDEELSHEYQSPETGQWQGATTYFFHKLMATYRADMTWADVHDFVQTNVHAVYPAQSPQLEGPANLQLFGGIAADTGRALLVTDIDGEHFVKLNGGITTGLTPGAKIAVYPPASDLTGEPLVAGTVDEVKVDHAWVKLDQPATVERASRAKITSFAIADQSVIVAIEDADGTHKAAVAEIEARIAGDGVSAFLALNDEHGASRPAHYVVQIREGRFHILDATGVQVIDASPPATGDAIAVSAAQIVDNLEHIAIYNNVLTLRNPLPDGLLQNAVTIEGAVTWTKRQRNNMPADPTELDRVGNVASITAGEKLFFELVNNTTDDLYLALFMLTPDFGVTKLFPQRAGHERVAGGKRIPIPSSVTLDNSNLASGKQIYKVIASSEPIDYSVLALPELNQERGAAQSGTRAAGSSALAQLLNRTRYDGTRGGALLLDEATDDQWMTTQFEILILAADRTQTLAAGETSAVVEAQLLQMTVEKPAAFEGSVRIGSLAQSTRSTGDAIALPPAMRSPELQRYFEPLTLGGGNSEGGKRSALVTPAVITLEGDASQLAAITPEAPLSFRFAVDNEPGLQGIVPIAFDGQCYYVAGETVEMADAVTDSSTPQTAATTRSGAGSSASTRQVTVQIERLPGALESDIGESAATATRSVGRTARLFFYKLFYSELPPDTGLRKAGVTAAGEVIYEPVAPADVTAATRIGLLVHGINSDTGWMVEKIWPLVKEVGQYDLCLTFDYETFGTGIWDNGLLLHRALEAIGVCADDGKEVDVFAHSMGSQVARAVVERFGGKQYVDRVFMGGAPNAGSPLVKSRKLIPWLGTILINQVGAVPAALVVSWFLRKSVEAGMGLADLDPDSDFYKNINQPTGDPVSVPYFIQTGNYSALAQGRDHDPNFIHLFRRLGGVGDMGLDSIFGGDHDLAVGVSSARVIENSDWPNAQVHELGVTHWGYFHTEDGWALLREWLKG